MTKLDATPPSLTYPLSSHFNREPVNCLIVLFPAEAIDYPNQTRRIWEIASLSGRNVVLLSLCSDDYAENQLRRQLITQAAMIGDGHICAEVRIEHGNDWIRHVNNIYRAGDVIACYAGQRVGLRQKPLHEALRSQFDAPIYILATDQPIKKSKPKLMLNVAFWAGALAIIAGFLWLEVRVVQLPQDWAHSLLVYLSVFAEIGILLFWNSIFT